MANEFVVRVEEETPSDEKYAVRHLETVVGGEYIEKLAALVARMEKVTLTTNVEIMTEIKNLLADLLVFIGENKKEHSAIMDLLSRTDSSGDIAKRLANLEKGYISMSEVYLGAAEALSRVEDRLGEMSVVAGEHENKMDERLNNLNMAVTSLGEKVAKVTDHETLGKMASQLSSVASKNHDIDEKMNEIKNMNMIAADAARSVIEKQERTDSRLSDILIEVEKLNSELSSTKVKPKPRRRTRSKTRAGRKIEDQALDVIILNTLKKVSMNITSLRRATGLGEKRLRDRLEVLMTRSVIVRERRGSSIFYVSKANENAESGN